MHHQQLHFRQFFLSIAAALILATLAGSDAAEAGSSKPPEPAKLNVVLIVIDTLGAGHLGAYGVTPSPSPEIDRFAKRGVIFTRALSSAPWTKPSVASMFTGLFPYQHGVTGLNAKVPNHLETLAEMLQGAGLATGGFVSHTFLDTRAGFSQGFSQYEIVKFRGNVHDSITSDQVTDLGLTFLDEHKTKPFFLFLHYFDPHFNYQHHQQFDRTSWYKGSLKPGIHFRALRRKLPSLGADDFKVLRGWYDEEIAYTDLHIGRFLEGLKSKGLEQQTLVILTADHGEEFMEHGSIGHTRTLYDELVHVPFIVAGPGIRSGKVTDAVSPVDIVPTVKDFLGMSSDDKPVSGTSILPVLKSSKASLPSRTLISEVDFTSKNIKAYLVGAFQGTQKLIHNKKTGERELYDVATDPGEKNNRALDSSIDKSSLEAALKEYFQHQSTHPAGQTEPEITRDAEEMEQLKSLGYL